MYKKREREKGYEPRVMWYVLVCQTIAQTPKMNLFAVTPERGNNDGFAVKLKSQSAYLAIFWIST